MAGCPSKIYIDRPEVVCGDAGQAPVGIPFIAVNRLSTSRVRIRVAVGNSEGSRIATRARERCPFDVSIQCPATIYYTRPRMVLSRPARTLRNQSSTFQGQIAIRTLSSKPSPGRDTIIRVQGDRDGNRFFFLPVCTRMAVPWEELAFPSLGRYCSHRTKPVRPRCPRSSLSVSHPDQIQITRSIPDSEHSIPTFTARFFFFDLPSPTTVPESRTHSTAHHPRSDGIPGHTPPAISKSADPVNADLRNPAPPQIRTSSFPHPSSFSWHHQIKRGESSFLCDRIGVPTHVFPTGHGIKILKGRTP